MSEIHSSYMTRIASVPQAHVLQRASGEIDRCFFGVLIVCCLRQADLCMRILRSGMCARVLMCLCVFVPVCLCVCVCPVDAYTPF